MKASHSFINRCLVRLPKPLSVVVEGGVLGNVVVSLVGIVVSFDCCSNVDIVVAISACICSINKYSNSLIQVFHYLIVFVNCLLEVIFVAPHPKFIFYLIKANQIVIVWQSRSSSYLIVSEAIDSCIVGSKRFDLRESTIYFTFVIAKVLSLVLISMFQK